LIVVISNNERIIILAALHSYEAQLSANTTTRNEFIQATYKETGVSLGSIELKDLAKKFESLGEEYGTKIPT